MRKILLVFAIALLLAGCVLPWGSKDELEMVPKSANAVVILRLSAMFNDSDLSLQTWQNMSSELKRAEETSGVNPSKIDRLVLFMKVNSLQSTSESYGGFIARGTMDKNNILEKMRVNNVVTEMDYANHNMYEISSNEEPENKSYFSFLDDNTIVGGTRQAVQDSIDTDSGKMESVKSNKQLIQVYDMLDKNSLVMFFMEISPDMKSEMSDSQQTQLNTAALSHVNSTGFSFVKGGKATNFKLLFVAEDDPSASDISDFFTKGLSTLKGLVPAGSTSETVVKKVKVETKGSIVTVSLLSTTDQLKKLQDELQTFSTPTSQES